MAHQVKRARRRGEDAVSKNAHRVRAKTPFLKSASRAGESTIFEAKNGGQAKNAHAAEARRAKAHAAQAGAPF